MTLPTGRVAFLFSDVEGSTRRWERHGEAMRAALRLHDELLRTEIEARGGYVFKTIGDAFCAAFASVGEALEAAVEVQRGLARTDFTAVDGMLVRMAIHVGEADERDGDYFGSTVNRTARLLSAGHGGQILLTGEAADLARAMLPSGITLRHLGSLPLRDIKEPQRVYQPIGAELRSEFKALRALETPPNNLPRQTTSFVGRHEDLTRVEAMLEEGPLVTISGAGGIGKTRLALEVATERLNDQRDGAWFVDLAAVGDASLLPATILGAIGGELPANADPLDALVAYLQNRELLLVLDNSEHLVAQVAQIVAELIARCPHVSVLATSRSPLDISGERIYRLASLDAASALALFSDRASAANPAFRLESHRSTVEQICARLDGIALAIELAAARVRTMSVDNLASHLELRLLAGGRDRRPRQQTMRALIDWSHELLTSDEQRVLRRTAVFVRGFTLSAAAEVCANEGDDEYAVLNLLTALVDKSLVIVDELNDEQRYRVLEPIREYAYEKLIETGELAESLRRHAVALAALARRAYEEWDRGPGAHWLAGNEAELPNLRAALRWALDEGNDLELGAQLVADATVLFLRLSLLEEGIAYCTRVLDARLVLAPEVEARLRYGLSMLYSTVGAGAKCLDEGLAAVSLYRAAKNARGLSRALSQVASRFGERSIYGESERVASEALQLARGREDRYLLADVLRRCGYAFEQPDRVREVFAESITLFRGLGRASDTGRALQWSAQWEMARGEYRAAAERLLEAVRLNDREFDIMLYSGDLASCYLAMGDHSLAETYARRGLTLAAKMRHAVCACIGVTQLAVILGDADAAKAARLIGYAQARFDAIGFEPSSPEDGFIRELHERLRGQIEPPELALLVAEGAAWNDDQAVTHALSA